MLQATRLSKRFGDRVVLRGLDFQIPPGSCAAVVGFNGAGKSTLLRIIAGLTSPSRGEILWESQKPKPFCALAAPDAPIYRELSCLENLEFFSRGEEKIKLQKHLEKWDLVGRENDLAGDLSSGLRVRLGLCVAAWFCEKGAPILLLDEPSANLDEAGRELVARLIFEQKQRGIVLLATNDSRDFKWCNMHVSVIEKSAA